MHKKNADGTYSEIKKKKPKRAYNKKVIETFIQDKQGKFSFISLEAAEQLVKLEIALHEKRNEPIPPTIYICDKKEGAFTPTINQETK